MSLKSDELYQQVNRAELDREDPEKQDRHIPGERRIKKKTIFFLHDLIKLLDQRIFGEVGCLSTLGREGEFHDPPADFRSARKPAARRLAPRSDSRVYVMILRYPRLRASFAAAANSLLATLGDPSVASRVISSVAPSSRWRDTGLPTIAHPDSTVRMRFISRAFRLNLWPATRP